MNELKLLAGDAIEIDKFCKVYPITLREIKEIGEIEYYKMLSYIINFNQEIEIQGQKIDFFDYLIALSVYDIEFRNKFIKSLSFFVKEDVGFFDIGEYYIGDINNERILTKEYFIKIQEVLKEQNFIKEKKDRQLKPANSKAEELKRQLEEKRRQLAKQNKQENSTSLGLADIASMLATYVPSINIINVYDLTIYQLYTMYSRLMMKNDFDLQYHLYANILAYHGSNAVKDFQLKHWATKISQE